MGSRVANIVSTLVLAGCGQILGISDFTADPAVVDAAGIDVGCTASSACAEQTPVCGPAGMCLACVGADSHAGCANHDPSTPVCDTASGRCVTCVSSTPAAQSADCDLPTQPICAADACRACQAPWECTSGACKPDGSCAAASEIVYVDSGFAGCGSGDGSSTSPVCQVQAGVALAKTALRAYVVVRAAANPYGAVSITLNSGGALTLTIVGPSAGGAQISATGAPAFSLQVISGSANVVLDGLSFTSNSDNGVTCGAGGSPANLTIRRSALVSSAHAGISSSACTNVTLDASIVRGNLQGGVSLASCPSYTITNDIIAQNGSGTSTFGGLKLSGSSGFFAFDTIADNAASTSVAGGATCDAAIDLTASIIVANQMLGGTQLSGCRAAASVIGSTDTGTGIPLDPKFVDPLHADFHLVKGDPANVACCFDKASQYINDHDVDWEPRPQGPYMDLGADEAQ